MRDIKFRAWIKNENKIVEVKSINCYTKKIMYSYSVNSQFYGNRSASFENSELMQFTGLKDKNGKDIFDGDIFKCGKTLYQVFYAISGFKVKYIKGHNENYLYDFTLDCFETNNNLIEVIGNIYENNDLFEVQ